MDGMNRRTFFASLAGVPVAGVRVQSGPEHAHTLEGGPICPRCGLHAMYSGPFTLDPELVNQTVPVECGCGWTGVHVRVRRHRP